MSKYTKSSLSKLKVSEVAEIAGNLGFTIEVGATKNEMIEAILEDQKASGKAEKTKASAPKVSKTHVNSADDDDSRTQKADDLKLVKSGFVMPQELRRAPKVVVTINASDKSDGKKPVKLSFNGHAYNVHRNVRVALPEPVFVNCLENAQETHYDRDENDKPVRNEVARFSYNVHERLAA
jgi:hypothetical protein